jgi:hypothetical protein
VQKSLRKASNSQPHPSSVRAVAINLRDYQIQPRSQGLSFYHLGETLAAAGHVPPRFWEVNLIVTVRVVGKERVCSVLKLQLWVMKFIVNLQQEIVKRTFKLIFIS